MNIQLQGVAKRYGSSGAAFWALRAVDLEIEGGEFCAVVGPSGSGKSTLLHLLGCLDHPTEGDVCVDGRPIRQLSDRALSLIRRHRIGFVFQQFYLNDSMTALQNVLLPLEIARVRDRRRHAEEALAAVDLNGKRGLYPGQLSGGEQQRCAMARALANDPELLLADEPTGALDSSSGQRILDLLASLHQDRSLSVVIVTHDMQVADQAHRRINVLDGRVT
jgi:putative ABC transport system ATP-binding protein